MAATAKTLDTLPYLASMLLTCHPTCPLRLQVLPGPLVPSPMGGGRRVLVVLAVQRHWEREAEAQVLPGNPISQKLYLSRRWELP